MDDLFIEVQRQRGEKLQDLDHPRLGRRGSGPIIGLKQRFAAFGRDERVRAVTAPDSTKLASPVRSEVNHKLRVRSTDQLYAASTDGAKFATPVAQKVIRSEDMKKIPTDPRIVSKSKTPSSNTQWYVPNEYLGLPSSGGVLHHAVTTDAPLTSLDLDNTVSDMSDGSGTQNPGRGEWILGGAPVDPTADSQVDEIDGQVVHFVVDHQKTDEAIEHYKKKVERIMRAIKAEQQVKQENVNEYLQLAAAASADKIQSNRIKAVFEKKNQKSTHLIGQLQRKMEVSMKRLKEVETYGICVSTRQGKGMLKDVGHGIRTIVSKPKEFAHLLKNKFGSADNISGFECLENGQSSEEGGHLVRRGSITLPSHFRYHSSDNVTNMNQETNTSLFRQDGVSSQTMPASLPPTSGISKELYSALVQLDRSREYQSTLQNSVTELQCQIDENHMRFKQALEEERVRREHLEEQVNDLMELHQNEVTNLKQELASIEEKMEYQLEERTRDMQDLLESCQTKITKMDLQQQQQQQLISMESFDNSTVRSLVTKLINVVLALLAVVLVLINTATTLLEPFVSTRIRCFATLLGVAVFAILWHNSDLISSALTGMNQWFWWFTNQ